MVDVTQEAAFAMDSSLESIATLPVQEVLKSHDIDLERGLTQKQVEQRLEQFGPNKVSSKPKTGPAELLLRQFQSSVVILLLVAAIISFATHDNLQAAGILAAVFINAIVGFATELKAQISLESLEQIAGPTSRVLREGHDLTIPSSELVPGDIVILDQGTRVPADLRLLETHNLKIDESIVTGESIPVYKCERPVDGLGASVTTALHGTYVLEGRGLAVVTKTGKNSTLGQLQCSLYEGHSVPTPLEQRLDGLGQQLTWLTVLLCVLIAVVGLLQQQDFWMMLEASIALAVAAIPEGLPVVATLALAIGTQRMVKAGALIRQLAAVETLGCTTVICSDKTGTLTENKLQVTDIYVDAKSLSVTGSGYEPRGEIKHHGESMHLDPALQNLLRAAALCNDATLEQGEQDQWTVSGDPTEGALLAAAGKIGIERRELEKTHPRISEIPFDLSTKKMTTLHKLDEGDIRAFIKGSPERVIRDSIRVHTSEGESELDERGRKVFLEKNDEYANQGLRVLAIASKRIDESCEEEDHHSQANEQLTLLGLVAMRDVPRKGVGAAIDRCRQAGIRVLMLTGDHPSTAKSIARELHISDDGGVPASGEILLGSDLENLSQEQLILRLNNASVLARVTPRLKLEVVKALQASKNVVAMTGDGVNDAPALQQANIGVAMGQAGTDLAREASNMVITDDNFSTIVGAIEQGRIIYDNIRRAICYLLTAALASVVTVAGVMIFDNALPLTPLQLLWLNLVMHIFPGLGIVLQGAAPGMMERPPRDPQEKLLGRFEISQIVAQSFIVSLSVLVAIEMYKLVIGTPIVSTTIAFATISFALLFQAWSWLFIRPYAEHGKERAPINSFMYLMMFISYALVFMGIYLPGLNTVLETAPLSLYGLSVATIMSTASMIVCWLYTWFDRRIGVGGSNATQFK